MRIPNPYFKNIPFLGNLVMDYIIFEDGYPVLFVCKNDKNRLYLCDCCDIYAEQKWLIAPVTLKVLRQMFENKITIREVFELAEGYCCVATWHKGDLHEKYEIISAGDFQSEDLPEKGAYIDAEDDEYADYIALLINRRIYQKQFRLDKYMKLIDDNEGSELDTMSLKVEYKSVMSQSPCFAQLEFYETTDSKIDLVTQKERPVFKEMNTFNRNIKECA